MLFADNKYLLLKRITVCKKCLAKTAYLKSTLSHRRLTERHLVDVMNVPRHSDYAYNVDESGER
jgi:hypothetical protein